VSDFDLSFLDLGLAMAATKHPELVKQKHNAEGSLGKRGTLELSSGK
jgi:hypothetical protein